MENLWKNMNNMKDLWKKWKNCVFAVGQHEYYGKPLEKRWKNYGKPWKNTNNMENLWKNCGKLWFNHGRT
jgi:spore coat polysaccharide biosynthesis predicted glycosyltransferase SpsG